jgi:hypothetical protein
MERVDGSRDGIQQRGNRNAVDSLFNDTLRSGRVKGWRFVCALEAPFCKAVFAVLAADFLPRAAFGPAQNGSDTFACKKRALGQSLGVTAVTVILGVITQTGLDAVRCSVV